jgi:glycosyltransferase involved in cell wall biosynthesis
MAVVCEADSKQAKLRRNGSDFWEMDGTTAKRLGWFSTWNSRCGIATYSRFLVDNIDGSRFSWTVLASQDELLVEADDGRVIRCWTDNQGSVLPLLDVLRRERFDILVVNFKIQVNFNFLKLEHLEAIIACCHATGTKVVVILHATVGADPAGDTVAFRRIAKGLATVHRVLVHSEKDIDRLARFGVGGNVTLFPHGHIDRAPPDTTEVRRKLGLPVDRLVIGSYGFLLPNKGVDTLIRALPLIQAAGIQAELMLVNALYPLPLSEALLELCKTIAAKAGVEKSVHFEPRFLPDQQSFERLAACDLIIYPYQDSQESASGAVRFGLSSQRPVLCSPVSIFSDVVDVVTFLPGGDPEHICQGVCDFVSGAIDRDTILRKQRAFIAERSWSMMGQRLQEILDEPAAETTREHQAAWLAEYVLDTRTDLEDLDATSRNAQSAAAAAIRELQDRVQRLEPWEAAARSRAKELADVYGSRWWRMGRLWRQTGNWLRNPTRSLRRWRRRTARKKASPPAALRALSVREHAIFLDLKRARAPRKDG